MKKIFLSTVILCSIITSSFANEKNEVSFRILNSFKNTFSDVQDLNWKITNNYVKASFVLDNKKTEAYYSYDGNLMGTSKPIAFDKLPKAAIKKITKKFPFPPYTLKECIEVTNAEGEISYYVSLLNEKQIAIILQINNYGQITTVQ